MIEKHFLADGILPAIIVFVGYLLFVSFFDGPVTAGHVALALGFAVFITLVAIVSSWIMGR